MTNSETDLDELEALQREAAELRSGREQPDSTATTLGTVSYLSRCPESSPPSPASAQGSLGKVNTLPISAVVQK